jgi:hypothetical protein
MSKDDFPSPLQGLVDEMTADLTGMLDKLNYRDCPSYTPNQSPNILFTMVLAINQLTCELSRHHGYIEAYFDEVMEMRRKRQKDDPL